MGLDLALAVVILIAAYRGWAHGFISQTVRIASFIACVYLADRVRDYVKPYVVPYLSSIQPDLIDRLMWWVSAAATYIILVGVSMLVIKMTRRPEIPGIPQSGRNDQFAGFLLGAVKGLLLVAFLAAGIQKYALDQVKTVAWGEDQVNTSWVLKWSAAYQPVPKIWSSRVIRHFVDHIQRMGLQKPGAPSQAPAGEESDDDPLLRTAIRPTDLGAPGVERSAPESTKSSRSRTSGLPAESTDADPDTEKSGAVSKPVSTPRDDGSK